MPGGLNVLEHLTRHVNNVLVVLTLNWGNCHIYHRGEWMGARLGWKRACRLICLGCNAYKRNALHAMLVCTVFLFTERILNQARGASVPLHVLAWAWGALSRHRAVGFYKKSESLYASWRWPCGGPLQVTWLLKTAVTWSVLRPNQMELYNVNTSTVAIQNAPLDGLVAWLLLLVVLSRITHILSNCHGVINWRWSSQWARTS